MEAWTQSPSSSGASSRRVAEERDEVCRRELLTMAEEVLEEIEGLRAEEAEEEEETFWTCSGGSEKSISPVSSPEDAPSALLPRVPRCSVWSVGAFLQLAL